MGYSELGIHRRVGHRMRQPLVHSKLLSGLQATNNPPPRQRFEVQNETLRVT